MEIRNISKSFEGKVVFSSLNLHIHEGCTTIISGASGIGKTTLFNLILGLEEPDGGVIEGFGKVSALFQEDRLIESLSVMNNLLLVTQDKKRAENILSSLSLFGEEKSRVSTLSGGMKRRIALIRALLTDYDTLLLDEPFTGLDDESKRASASLIKKEVASRTLIVITHEKSDADLLGAEYIISFDGVEVSEQRL